MPISANFSGGHIYTGPSGTYVKAVTNASGQSVEILWKEGNFFYVRYIGPQNIRVQGYVPDTNISSISGGNYSVFYPTINEEAKRYVSQNANAFLGESTTYNTIYPPEYGLQQSIELGFHTPHLLPVRLLFQADMFLGR